MQEARSRPPATSVSQRTDWLTGRPDATLCSLITAVGGICDGNAPIAETREWLVHVEASKVMFGPTLRKHVCCDPQG